MSVRVAVPAPLPLAVIPLSLVTYIHRRKKRGIYSMHLLFLLVAVCFLPISHTDMARLQKRRVEDMRTGVHERWDSSRFASYFCKDIIYFHDLLHSLRQIKIGNIF